MSQDKTHEADSTNNQSPFARVIADQQAVIDDLRQHIESNAQYWNRRNEVIEDLVATVFALLSNDSDTHRRSAAREIALTSIRALGFCVRCECQTCNCD